MKKKRLFVTKEDGFIIFFFVTMFIGMPAVCTVFKKSYAPDWILAIGGVYLFIVICFAILVMRSESESLHAHKRREIVTVDLGEKGAYASDFFSRHSIGESEKAPYLERVILKQMHIDDENDKLVH